MYNPLEINKLEKISVEAEANSIYISRYKHPLLNAKKKTGKYKELIEDC